MELFVKAFTADLVIPEFEPFCQEIRDIYNLCKNNYAGKVQLGFLVAFGKTLEWHLLGGNNFNLLNGLTKTYAYLIVIKYQCSVFGSPS